ncbi:MAG: hypothetical protein ABII74_00705 [Elusimicrobiota bacterium]
MDSGQGHFVTADNQEELRSLINNYPDHGGIFSIGQTVEVEGSYFKVSKITPKKTNSAAFIKSSMGRIAGRTDAKTKKRPRSVRKRRGCR